MSRFGKFIKRHVKQAESIGKKTLDVAKQMNPMGGQGGGMFGMGGGKSGGGDTIVMAGQSPEDQARAQAAQAMKRQAGGGQISFTGDGTTPDSQVG
jgi:hypothetical protein